MPATYIDHAITLRACNKSNRWPIRAHADCFLIAFGAAVESF